MGYEPGVLPYQKIRTLTACAGLVTLCGTIFPCFRLNVCSCALLLKHVYHMAPGQSHYRPLQGTDGILLLQHKKDACRPTVLCWLQGGDLLATVDQCTLLKLILLCLFSMWVKHCSIQCLSLLCFPSDYTTKMQWAEVFRSLLLLTSNRYHLMTKNWILLLAMVLNNCVNLFLSFLSSSSSYVTFHFL